jgi:hypothetical protein
VRRVAAQLPQTRFAPCLMTAKSDEAYFALRSSGCYGAYFGRCRGDHCTGAFRGFVTPAVACWMYVRAVAEGMRKISYAGYRFPPEVIHQAIWLSLRFDLGIGPEIPVEPLSRLQHLQRPRPSHLRSDTPDGDEHVVPRRHCRREHSRLKQIGYTSLRTAFRISRPKRAKFLRSRSLFDHSA